MLSKTNAKSAKNKQQSIVKIVFWTGAFVALFFTVQQIAYIRNPVASTTQSASQAEQIEAHSADLSEKAQELETTLNEVQFDDDIQALRDL